MKKLLLAALLFASVQTITAQTSILNDTVRYLCTQHYKDHSGRDLINSLGRSDTFDILHFIIGLDMTGTGSQTIAGNCQVQFRAKMNNTGQLLLDLEKMNVDSVKQNGQIVPFSYSDSTTVAIDLLNTLQNGDSAAVTVYYRGRPQADYLTFGGMYFRSGYAYNLGVGPNFYPHSTGRTWFPCFDNFFERSTYEFYVRTANGQTALCNGLLIDTVGNDTSLTWHWKLKETIPSYLANIAVGNYALIQNTFNGKNGSIPVQLASAPADTTKVKNSFIHLPDAFSLFEQRYGAYQWEKVGYVMVPFSNIAMEHATNISYPITSATGNTNNEHLLVHELAHHWFGDLVTPRTVEDYWLKEGWAVYSEMVFFESLYGRTRFLDELGDNHDQALRTAHIFDNGYLAESPVPQQYTYGKTVYNKGCDMAHSLRAYMGDSLLFRCLRGFVQDNAYSGQDSYNFRDYLQNCSGVDLTDFFNDWIFSPGFPHFSIDSFQVQPAGNEYEVTVYIRQRLNHAPHYYKNVPLEVTFMNQQRESTTKQISVSGSCTVYKTTLPFNPAFACTDFNEKLSDAIGDNHFTIGAKGGFNFKYGKMNVVATNVPDTAFLRIEHNYIPADAMKTAIPGLHLSQERYWRVDGILPDSFDARGILNYNGQSPAPTSFSNYYLDTKLITNTEDSLELMYRPSVSTEWEILTDRKWVSGGSLTDKQGEFTINHLKKGEYALAIWQSNKVDSALANPSDTCTTITAIAEPAMEQAGIRVYPNPSKDNFTIEGVLLTNSQLEVFNLNGQKVWESKLTRGSVQQQINTSQWGTGVFLLRLTGENQRPVLNKKLVVINNP